MRAAAALLALLVALAALAEVATRILLDDAVATAATVGLAGVSRDGQGFADVTGDARGWAVPDLVRGQLTGVDIAAGQGDLAGLPVQRITASAEIVELGDRRAQSVSIVATADPADLLPAAGELLEADLSGGTLTPVGPDLLRFSGDVSGVPLAADVRLALDGGGGLQATLDWVTADGVEVPAELVPSTPVMLVRSEELPSGFSVDSVNVRDDAGATLVEVGVRCPAQCELSALADLAAGAADSVRR